MAINGTTTLSRITGLSPAEIRWTFNRMKHLIHVEKKSSAEAKAIVAEESKGKPWLSP